MSIEQFSQWFFAQPEIVQRLVVYGPPLLVSAIIVLALGGSLRLSLLSWLHSPTVASALEADRRQEQDGADDWADSARASVDDLVARRRRGIH